MHEGQLPSEADGLPGLDMPFLPVPGPRPHRRLCSGHSVTESTSSLSSFNSPSSDTHRQGLRATGPWETFSDLTGAPVILTPVPL